MKTKLPDLYQIVIRANGETSLSSPVGKAEALEGFKTLAENHPGMFAPDSGCRLSVMAVSEVQRLGLRAVTR